MRKFKAFALVLILVICTVVIAGAAITYILVSNNAEKDEATIQPIDGNLEQPLDDVSLWQTYTNNEYNYSIKYPSTWYKRLEGYAPPPPTTIMFSTKPDGDNSYPYASTTVFSIVNPDISDINDHGEVTSLVSQGATKESVKIDGFDAVKLSSADTIAEHVSYYFIGNDNIVYRIGYQYPIAQKSYAADCELLVKSFTVTEEN